MKNKNYKSIGWVMEDNLVVDDSKGIDNEFVVMFKEGEKVDFEEGLEGVKNYMKMYDGMSCWNEVERLLNKLKEERKDDGYWVLWNVECDINLGYKVK